MSYANKNHMENLENRRKFMEKGYKLLIFG